MYGWIDLLLWDVALIIITGPKFSHWNSLAGDPIVALYVCAHLAWWYFSVMPMHPFGIFVARPHWTWLLALVGRMLFACWSAIVLSWHGKVHLNAPTLYQPVLPSLLRLLLQAVKREQCVLSHFLQKRYWDTFKLLRAAIIIDFLHVLAQEFIWVSGRAKNLYVPNTALKKMREKSAPT